MNTYASIRKAYDAAAAEYAEKWWNEFENKPFDRLILDWFAASVPKGERVLELGSGPGEVSGYLAGRGADCLGTDYSSEMIKNASKCFPQIDFEVQDFFDLKYPDESFFAAIAYYAIVNLELPETGRMLMEFGRVMKEGGLGLFTFHVFEHEEWLEVKDFFGKEGSPLSFRFHKVEEIKGLAEEAGLKIVDILERRPYPEIEYQSKRAYFIVTK